MKASFMALGRPVVPELGAADLAVLKAANDRYQANRVFAGEDPFDEATMVDDEHGAGEQSHADEERRVTLRR